jgi:hypothetical protein
MMRKILAALALVALAACTKPPVTDEVTIQFFEDRDDVRITAETKFSMNSDSPRVEAARTAAITGIDPWSVRFNRINPELDHITYERSRGELERVIHEVRVPADDLQRVFSDTSVTMQILRGEGWRELSLYFGSTPRATREQQRQFDEAMRSWSHDVARYFIAIDHLYDYMDENPHRAEALFAALIASKDEDPPLVAEEELPFIEAVMASMDRIGLRMDAVQGDAATFGELADLIYNPFPAKLTIRAPREKDLVIEPIDLFQEIASLEGKWISPDPLAALLKAEEMPAAADLAAMPRKSASVIDASEIEKAIRAQLERPRTYRYRWQD